MPNDTASRFTLTRGLLIGGAALLVLWITFFDSHSLLNRYQWHLERENLSAENERLQQQIETLERKLDQPLSDEVVERIAREEYGMKRPDETVYPIESE
jgi:cell division protein FtsB